MRIRLHCQKFELRESLLHTAPQGRLVVDDLLGPYSCGGDATTNWPTLLNFGDPRRAAKNHARSAEIRWVFSNQHKRRFSAGVVQLYSRNAQSEGPRMAGGRTWCGGEGDWFWFVAAGW